jgi:fibronectin type 3 domain-containing protein
VTLTWTKLNGATGYEIYRNGTNTRLAKITKGTTTKYIISGLKAATSYSYKLRAYVIIGGKAYYSGFTGLVTATTKTVAPTLKLSSPRAKQAAISWNKVAGANGYELYRSTKKATGYKRVTTTTKKVSYTNKKLKSKVRYYYKVRSYKVISGKRYYSDYSKVKYVKIK